MNFHEFAADNSRAEFSPDRRLEPLSHWIDHDSEYITRTRQRAACGAVVDSTSFSTAPTCEPCCARLAELEAMTF